MARTGTVIGRKANGAWSSIGIGSASEMKEVYKYGKHSGFEKVIYFDTGRTVRRKKGSKVAAKPAAKKGEK